MHRDLWIGLVLFVLAGCGGSGGNQSFVVTSQPSTAAGFREGYSYQIVVANPAGTVTFTLVVGPAGVSVTPDGLVSWSPLYGDLGMHTVTVAATDENQALEQSWILRVHQGVDLGVTLSPRGHTGSSTPGDFAAHLDPTNGLGKLRAFHSAWRTEVSDGGEIPFLGRFATEMQSMKGFKLGMGFGWTVNGGQPDLTSESSPNDNTWNNQETRLEFLAMVTEFARLYQPPYLFLGNETNAYFLEHTQGEWDAWVSMFGECYDAIKAISPQTVVYTVFQYERLRGGGSLNGWNDPSHWQLLDQHVATGKLDAIGFTSYPYFDYSTPSAIPADYYDEIANHWTGPVVFTELGWLGSPSFPYPGGAQDQADFVMTFFQRTDDLPLSYVVYLFEHDFDGQASIPAFIDVGLKSNDGTPRPSEAIWHSAVMLRERP